MGLDRTHPQTTDMQCHQACSEVELTGKEELRPSQEQLEENRGRRVGQDRPHLEGDREVSPKQNEMVVAYHGPMLHR